jgi:DNA-binding transcriptional LysR family regulator
MALDDVEIFVKVVEYKSFSMAAKLLRLPKSTMSRRISQMEERLGVKLLNRTTRQLSPTPIGQAYYEKCIIVLDRLEEAQDLIKGLQAEPKGHLRLTVPYELGLLFLKETITGFLKAYPEVILELELTNRTVDLVEEGFDLALRIGHLVDSSLTAVKLVEMEGGIYGSPEFLKDKALPQHPSELSLNECIQFRTTHTKPWQFHHTDGKVIEVKPTGRVQVNSMDYMCEATLNGLGIAALNKIVATPYVQEGRLIEILKDYKLSYPNLFAVYPSRKFLSPNVRVFIDYLKPRLDHLKVQSS